MSGAKPSPPLRLHGMVLSLKKSTEATIPLFFTTYVRHENNGLLKRLYTTTTLHGITSRRPGLEIDFSIKANYNIRA